MTTIRQKLAASKLVENGGNMGKAMIAAGYSKATAKTPQKLTRSKGWRELMENSLPDELLCKKLRELIDAKNTIIVRRGNKVKVIKTINTNAVAKGLDMVLKLKGYYSSSNNESKTPTIIQIIKYQDCQENKLQ